MTITLTTKEWEELWAEAEMNSQKNPESNEYIYQMPRQLGKGYVREIEVYPHLLLSISDSEYYDDVLIKVSEYNHPLQFHVGLLGVNTDDTLISGAGVQHSWIAKNPKSQRSIGVDIHMPPELLGTFFSTADGKIPSQFSLLAKGDDWQTMLWPKKTAAVHSVAEQIINCPYQGIAKRMYLQVRVLELIRLQLTSMLVDQGGVQKPPRMKAETIARIHHAKEILHSRLENPPSLLELSQLVGVSDACGGLRLRTLRRGFQELFSTTVFSYITNQRMEWAEKLLRQGDLSVAEVANLVGYSNLGHFAATFKRRFGITPGKCLVGKKSVSGSEAVSE
ncbi:MAG: AraC family transcriptional regulator [Nostoc sp.]|uniref:helix-turn-helix transcriptional regulator n=1 Tax=Nostoc sp. TaxID=1180 RepID=UPI002FF8F48D